MQSCHACHHQSACKEEESIYSLSTSYQENGWNKPRIIGLRRRFDDTRLVPIVDLKAYKNAKENYGDVEPNSEPILLLDLISDTPN
jgi:hypothetical protein